MPDLAVIPGHPRDYADHPTSAALIIEVADSSLELDTGDKRKLYAEAGISDYWVVDVNDRRLFVFRNPRDGDYLEPQVLTAEAVVSPLAAPTSTIRVADLLG